MNFDQLQPDSGSDVEALLADIESSENIEKEAAQALQDKYVKAVNFLSSKTDKEIVEMIMGKEPKLVSLGDIQIRRNSDDGKLDIDSSSVSRIGITVGGKLSDGSYIWKNIDQGIDGIYRNLCDKYGEEKVAEKWNELRMEGLKKSVRSIKTRVLRYQNKLPNEIKIYSVPGEVPRSEKPMEIGNTTAFPEEIVEALEPLKKLVDEYESGKDR